MSPRKKLTLEALFDRVEGAVRFTAPAPRRRIRGEDGLLVWRREGVKAGLVVSPSLGGAFVFLQRARTAIRTDAEAIRILKGVFAGEVIEVAADGPRDNAIWLAWADAPAAHIHTFDRSRSVVEVPVFTSMAFRSWP